MWLFDQKKKLIKKKLCDYLLHINSFFFFFTIFIRLYAACKIKQKRKRTKNEQIRIEVGSTSTDELWKLLIFEQNYKFLQWSWWFVGNRDGFLYGHFQLKPTLNSIPIYTYIRILIRKFISYIYIYIYLWNICIWTLDLE